MRVEAGSTRKALSYCTKAMVRLSFLRYVSPSASSSPTVIGGSSFGSASSKGLPVFCLSSSLRYSAGLMVIWGSWCEAQPLPQTPTVPASSRPQEHNWLHICAPPCLVIRAHNATVLSASHHG